MGHRKSEQKKSSMALPLILSTSRVEVRVAVTTATKNMMKNQPKTARCMG
eukprot:CAMPEP_0168387804 /NCGR_PEP_ID=MMETSP0228-20121227/16131_1 /TAXON_ID=133427 /ORGANISM="Protoceratium reticulatum, Strain CCCM 535 (=CCMP 1889)" /LENGTH=49 /DNA_ID= /DNA_START= /DNA_END= /DNA_ORIENTATION=